MAGKKFISRIIGISYRSPGHKCSCLDKGVEGGLGGLGRPRALVLRGTRMAAIDVPVITLKPQSMAGVRNLICMHQFMDWLSRLIYYLLGGQHTVIRISFCRVSLQWSSTLRLC